MYRKIDELGRFVIPKEIRNTLGLKTGDEMKIEIKNNQVILEKENSINIKEYIQGKMLETDITTETYRVLNDVLEKLEGK